MKNQYHYIVSIIVYTILFLSNASQLRAQNNPSEVVASFGRALSSWCNTNQVSYRERIDQLCSGPKKCRVEDVIHAEYQKGRGLTNYETFVLDSYLNMFQSLIPRSLGYKMSNVKVVGSDEMPDGTLTFITADIALSGAINKSVTDLFLVRNNKISGIYSYSSYLGFSHLNGSLIQALKTGQYSLYAYYMGFSDIGVVLLRDKHGKKGIMDIRGNIIVPFIWDEIIYIGGEFAKGKNQEGQELIYDMRIGRPTPFSDVLLLGISSVLFSNGMAIVQDKSTKKWGYLRENDLSYSAITYIYDSPPSYFDNNGLAYIKVSNKNAIIDKNFRLLIQDNSKYEILYAIDKNLFKVKSKLNNKIGAINSYEEEIIPCMYDWIYAKSEGMIKVAMNNKFGFVNASGKLIIPCIYDEEDLGIFNMGTGNDPYHFCNGYCLIGRNDIPSKDPYFQTVSHGFIDKMGNLILPLNYTCNCDPHTAHIAYNDKFSTYYTIVERNDGKKTFMDLNRNQIRGFTWYEDLGYEHNGLVIFKMNGKYGYLNTNGIVEIPPIFESVSLFENGYAKVSKLVNGIRKQGLINSNGVQIVPCIYDNEIEFVNGIAIVEKNGHLGLIDRYGNSIFF